MFPGLINGMFEALPSQCLVCHAWPAQPLCEDCVNRFAQPQPRCQTCALPVPMGVRQCGMCVKSPPPLDTCLAAVSYAYPWSDLIVGFKFQKQPGRARAFSLLLRSTPWVEPALDAADAVVPMPLSGLRLRSRGFNQALMLARQLAPDKTDSRLLLRIKDTPPQSSLKRAERLGSVKDAFAVDPLLLYRTKGARLVLVDDVMTSGASLFSAARALRAAGAAHITGVVIARTE
ncbi:phosphoribosyltransferase family protein [Rhodoferax sp.]|uniref:phosphoribosyltransferase family protein n=1 Tax=Rhodoferax sp. TaxID=50421 RepID=UPI00272539AB|nr:phosphoribosyltransferase family protein [Rhodoferax sp.]MDO9195159.1 phosphoribosyltransferase family protein [Rhodoferax sp.]